MKNTRILYITPRYYPNLAGGSERSIKMLAEGIASKKGYECYVLSFDGTNKKISYEEYNKVKVIRVKKISMSPDTLSQNISLIKYRKIIYDIKPNLIHVYNTYHIPSSFFFKKVCPVVATLNNYFAINPISYTPDNIMERKKMNSYDMFTSLYKSFKGSTVKKLSMSIFYTVYWEFIITLGKRLDLYIPISKTTGKIHALQGFDSKKIVPVYNISTKDLSVKDKSKIKRKNNKIIYIGGLLPSKGVNELLAAFKDISHKDVKLHIIGGGILFDEFKEYAQKNKLNVIMHGKLPHEKLENFYRESTFIVHPSLWPDPMPRVILEILHYDIPVIAANNPVAMEAFGDGAVYYERGNIKDLTNKIDLMLDGKIKTNLEYGRKTIFGIDPIERVRSLYEEVMTKYKYRY